jgi:hypothetical protein
VDSSGSGSLKVEGVGSGLVREVNGVGGECGELALSVNELVEG